MLKTADVGVRRTEALRNHARRMLLTVAAEMATTETDEQQQAKSRGEAPVLAGASDTAAETHGDQRYFLGFRLEELIAEFHALRASVIRLWMHQTTIDDRTVYELTQLGRKLPLEGAHMDAARTCEEVLHPFQQLHPECDIRLEISGDVSGEWDRNRIRRREHGAEQHSAPSGSPTTQTPNRVMSPTITATLTKRGARESVPFAPARTKFES